MFRRTCALALVLVAARLLGADGYTFFVMGTNEVTGPVISRDRFIGSASGLSNASPAIATNAANASNNWVLSLTGNAVAWQPIHTTNFYGSIAQITNQTLIGSTNWATPLITLTQNWVGIGGPAFPFGANVQISAENLAVVFRDTSRGRLYIYPTTASSADYNASQSRWVLRPDFGYNTVLGLYCAKDNGVLYLTGGSGDSTRPIISLGDAPPVTTGGPGSVYLSGDTVRIRQNRVISSNTAASYPGEIAWDTNRLWVATGTNQWRHLNLSDYSTNFSVMIARTNTGSSAWNQSIAVAVPGGALSVGLVFEPLAYSAVNANTFEADVRTQLGAYDNGAPTFIQLFDASDGSGAVFRSPVFVFAASPNDTLQVSLQGTIAQSGDYVYGRLHVFIRRP
jgi:hypothetical protein